jgi:hypothetical protein
VDVVYTYWHGDHQRYKPLSIKPAKELEKLSVAKRLEVERIYFTTLGPDWDAWGLVTERDLDPIGLRNITLLHGYHSLLDRRIDEEMIHYVRRPLTELVLENPEMPLNQLSREMDSRIGRDDIVSLNIAYHLIATRHWCVDLRAGQIPDTPLRILSVAEDLLKGDIL